MKRKRYKREGTFINNGEVITTDRPMIDLPKDHPFRNYMKAKEMRWKTNEDGVRTMSISNHHAAKEAVMKLLPQAMDKIDMSKGTNGFCQTNLLKNGLFRLVLGVFIMPDDDDPDRVESGWFALIAEGPWILAKEYEARGKASLNNLL